MISPTCLVQLITNSEKGTIVTRAPGRGCALMFIRCSYTLYEHCSQELFIRMNTSLRSCSYSV